MISPNLPPEVKISETSSTGVLVPVGVKGGLKNSEQVFRYIKDTKKYGLGYDS